MHHIEHYLKNHEKYKGAMNSFDESCEVHNITTLGQKIDFFVYLFYTSPKINPKIMEHKFNPNKPNQHHSNSNLKKTRKNFRNTKESISSNKSINHKNNMVSRRNSKSLSDLKQVYYYEIKSAFKVTDEMVQNNMTSLEKFEKELSNKIRNFQVVKENLESSQKLIDKLKLHLLIQEISSDNIILRECNINAEKFVFLLYKKYFDFS